MSLEEGDDSEIIMKKIVDCFALAEALFGEISPYLESYVQQLSQEAFSACVYKLQHLIDMRALKDELLQELEEQEDQEQGCRHFRNSIYLLDVFYRAN